MIHANEQVESWALGALMDAGGDLIREAVPDLLGASGLTAEDFTGESRRAVFQAVKSLADQQRPTAAADVFAICKGLPGVPTFEQVRALMASNSSNREAYLGHAGELRRLTILRRMEAFHKAELAALEAKRPDPILRASAISAFAQATTTATAPYRTCGEDTFALAERMEAFASGKRETVIPTGIDALDEEIGGLRPTLTVLGGLPGAGKSALVATILGNLAARGVRCGLFGLEDGTQWVTDRLVSREAFVALADLDRRRFHEHEQEALQTGMGRVQHWMSHVEKCAPVGRMKPVDLVARAKDWVLNRGVKAIFVDHIGELDHGGNRERHDLSVGDSLSELRRIAIDHNVPVVAVAHLRRDYEAKARGGDGKPMLSHFAESAYIERMARLALGIWAGPNDDTMHVSILKFTSGKAGTTLALPRITQAALVSSKGGRVVDLSAPKEEH